MFIERNKNGNQKMNIPNDCSLIKLKQKLKAYFLKQKRQLSPHHKAKNLVISQRMHINNSRCQQQDQLRKHFGFDKYKLQALLKEELNIFKRNAEFMERNASKLSFNNKNKASAKVVSNSYAFIQRSQSSLLNNKNILSPMLNPENQDDVRINQKQSLSNQDSISKILKHLSKKKKNNKQRASERTQTQNIKQLQISSNKRHNSPDLNSNERVYVVSIEKNGKIACKLQQNVFRAKQTSVSSQLSPWKQTDNKEHVVLPLLKNMNRCYKHE